jgi:hypothetical protein
MGYTHITDICQFIPTSLIQKSSGTWTTIEAGNVAMESRTAADTSFELVIPLNLPGATSGLLGAKITSIDVWYKIGTAAADDFATVEVTKNTMPADGDAVTGAAVTCSLDVDHDTAAERLAVDEHKMTITITNPEFIEDDEFWYVHIEVDCAATTVFTLYGAQVNYTLRL